MHKKINFLEVLIVICVVVLIWQLVACGGEQSVECSEDTISNQTTETTETSQKHFADNNDLTVPPNFECGLIVQK